MIFIYEVSKQINKYQAQIVTDAPIHTYRRTIVTRGA